MRFSEASSVHRIPIAVKNLKMRSLDFDLHDVLGFSSPAGGAATIRCRISTLLSSA